MNKFAKLILLLGLTFTELMVLASAITISYSTSEGDESVSSSVAYDLDDSTLLEGSTILNGASIVQDQKASGSGKNSISQSVNGNGYTIKNSMENSGSFNAQANVAATGNEAGYSQSFVGSDNSAILQTIDGNGYSAESSASGFGILSASTSTMASPASASLSQQAFGRGDANLALSGFQGLDMSEQRVRLTGGEIASSQSLSAGTGVSVSQTTKLSGEAGGVESNAISAKNVLLASGSFHGQGVLDAKITANAADSATANGKVSLDGATWIDDEAIEGVSSGDLVMNVQGLRVEPKNGLGPFVMSVANMDRLNYDQNAVSTQNSGADSPSSYRLGGALSDDTWRLMRWNENYPNIKLWLKDDGYLAGTGLPKQDIADGIANAAYTWDEAVTRNLFLDGTGQVELSTSVSADTEDGKNVHAFLPFDNTNYAGFARTYSDIPIKYGFYSIYESDVSYNSLLSWSTTQSSGTNDVQGIALHELGHTLGLADLYYDPDNVNSLPLDDPRTMDNYQVMNSQQQRNLGAGDTTGIRLLYEYQPVALRADDGHYICAEGGGGRELMANRDWIGEWETFELADMGNDNVVLRANNGQYVCAELGDGSKKLVANRNAIGAWETFKINGLDIDSGGVVSVGFQADNGKWVCAESGGGRELVANRDAVNAWETFDLVLMGENDQHWQAKDLHYVCAEGGGGRELVANRDFWGAWEDFDGILLPDNKVALRAINGQYACAEGGGGSQVAATRPWIGPWESFTWEYLGSDSIYGDKFALRANNGQYLQADPGKGGMIWANSNDKTGWAEFYMYG